MEQRGIHITPQGESDPKATLTIVDPSTSGNARCWLDDEKQIKVCYVDDHGWCIRTADNKTCYFSENNPGKVEIDPWDAEFVKHEGDQGAEKPPVLKAFDDPNIQIVQGPITSTIEPGTSNTVSTQTITYLNVKTNYRFSETIRTVTKMEFATKELPRYDTVNLALGKTYRFTFVKDFESLGYVRDENSPYHSVYCGLYRVDKILSYKDVISSGIDVYNNLYAPIGVGKDVYEKDEPTFQNTMFYKLVDPRNEDTVVYVPLSFVEGTPDGSVARYDKIIMGINLGVFSDLDMVSDMVQLFEALLEVKYGIKADGKQFAKDTELVQLNRYDDVYLTTDEYNLINDARSSVMQDAAKSDVLKKLFTSEMNDLYTENARLREQLAAYENVIKNKKKEV